MLEQEYNSCSKPHYKSKFNNHWVKESNLFASGMSEKGFYSCSLLHTKVQLGEPAGEWVGLIRQPFQRSREISFVSGQARFLPSVEMTNDAT